MVPLVEKQQHTCPEEEEEEEEASRQGFRIPRRSTIAVAAALISLVMSIVALLGPRGREGVGAAVRGSIDVEHIQQKRQQRREQSTTYCWEDAVHDDGCWAKKPSEHTAECTADVGAGPCRCSTGVCDINDLHGDKPLLAQCSSHLVYVHKAQEHRDNVTGKMRVVTGKSETFCSSIVKTDEWYDRHLLKWPTDGANVTNASYWKCLNGYTWHNGTCQRKKRFIGETCWDGWALHPGGTCATADAGYKVACYEGRCMPRAWAEDWEKCECAWLGWNFVVTCSAASGQCNGHACAMNADDGNKYCDYGSAQTW